MGIVTFVPSAIRGKLACEGMMHMIKVVIGIGCLVFVVFLFYLCEIAKENGAIKNCVVTYESGDKIRTSVCCAYLVQMGYTLPKFCKKGDE